MDNDAQGFKQIVDTQKVAVASFLQGTIMYVQQMELMANSFLDLCFWLPEQNRNSMKELLKSTRVYYENLKDLAEKGYSGFGAYYSGARVFNNAFSGSAKMVDGFGNLRQVLTFPFKLLGGISNQEEKSPRPIS